MFQGLKFRDFAFDLPQELFVNDEYRKVEDVRLIVIDKKKQTIQHDMFVNIVNYFDDNDVLVFNDTGISPSRLMGTTSDGLFVDICFLMEENSEENIWEVVVLYEEGDPENKDFKLNGDVCGKIIKKTLPFDGGYWIEKDRYKGFRALAKINIDASELRATLDKYGKLMHPWYANLNNMPKSILNPITSSKTGGVLVSEPARRFTFDILEKLRAKGTTFMYPSLKMAFSWQVIQPEQYLHEYKMNFEEFSVDQTNIDILIDALQSKKRIVSVGTSGVRILESLPFPPKPVSSKTDIFVSPGFKFKYVDALLTNLHNSMGTHVIMACAIGGMELVLEACNIAVKEGYRFGIHGDSMLVIGDHSKPDINSYIK